MRQYFKEAGDLVLGDVYLHRTQHHAVRPRQVIDTLPGIAATTIEIVSKELDTGHIRCEGFFRCNRVELWEPKMRVAGAQQS